MITRVDLQEAPTGVIIHQYEDGWDRSSYPIEAHINYSSTLAEMVQWFKDHGWTVREWPGGARSFKGKPRPVRSEGQAKIEIGIHGRDRRLIGAAMDWQLDF